MTMSIQFAAASYSSAAEMIAAARKIRQRIMNAAPAPRKFVIVSRPATIIQLPMHKTCEMHFDHHIRCYKSMVCPMDYIDFHASEAGHTAAQIRAPSRCADIAAIRGKISYGLRMQFSLSLPEIGALINREHTSVMNLIRRHCSRNGLEYPAKNTKSVSDEVLNVIKAEVLAGGKITAVSRSYGAHPHAVVKRAVAEGWYTKTRTGNGQPRKQYDLIGMKLDYEVGVKLEVIAEKFGVSRRNVYRISRAKGWIRNSGYVG